MESNKKIAEDWFGAFQTKDISKLKLAVDFVHISPFGEVNGRETYLNLIKESPEAFFSSEIKIIDIFDCEDKFSIRYLVDDRPACDCIYIENGEIKKIYSYYHFGEKPQYENL